MIPHFASELDAATTAMNSNGLAIENEQSVR